RGNIHTRLGKVPEGGAIVMAAAALEVLGISPEIIDYFAPAVFVPSPGQGCVAIECRFDDSDMIKVIGTIDDDATRQAVEAERAFLAELGSGCSLPVGAHADARTLTAFLGSADGRDHLIESIELTDDHDLALTRSAELARSMHKRLQ